MPDQAVLDGQGCSIFRAEIAGTENKEFVPSVHQ